MIFAIFHLAQLIILLFWLSFEGDVDEKWEIQTLSFSRASFDLWQVGRKTSNFIVYWGGGEEFRVPLEVLEVLGFNKYY